MSELELPEWQAFALAGADAAIDETDIAIRLGDTLEAAPVPDHLPEVEGDTVRFSVPDTGKWEVSAGNAIEVHPLAGADPIAVRLFTLGTAWGVTGYQRGWPMLHGSAVMGPKGAVLFCGRQGAGKSTLAAALAERGCPLVSDDLSRAVPGRADRPTMLYPSSVRHKLWEEAIAGLGMTGREKVRDHMQMEKFHIATERHVPLDQPVPLVAIYALRFGGEIAIEREMGGDAAHMLLAQTAYRPRFLEAMGRLTEQAVYAAQISASVPIHGLTRPRDFGQLDAVCDRILAHMESH
ncbi:hypothetical protein [Erythrobacter litoralis]|uniref:hypothetical protein n=1 Tax=Erythrobacter litoralis TaxID=39960 RepID=UPI001F19CE99|nr:hypothetical protein [Erythrobacter litoralis]